MLQVYVGHSEDVLASEATAEVLGQLREVLGGAQPQAGVLFCSLDFDHAVVLAAIQAAFPAMELIGCTTDGEMSSVQGFREDSVVLMVFVSDTVEIRAGIGRQVPSQGVQAGRDAAAMARAKLTRRAGEERFMLLLADPLSAGISGVNEGIQDVLGRSFPAIGGASAAHSKLRKTHQFCGGEVCRESVVVLLFAGPVAFSCGIKGGHSPLGARELVTQSRGNVLYRIGQHTAYEYFSKYIGKADLFMNFCLAVFEPGRESFYVLSAPASDPVAGSVSLNGAVAEGSMVQIGTADRATVAASCEASLRQALQDYPGARPSAALLFSCAGRKMIMGSQVVQEVQTVQRLLPGIPFSGYYCYGEFGPLEKGDPFLFHGTTFITLLLGAAD